MSDVAVPAVKVFDAPTCEPPLGQPAAVDCPGPHRKNVAEPVGTGPAPPLPMVSVSLATEPGAAPGPDGADALSSAGSRHERSGTGPVKSFSQAVDVRAVRGWGRMLLKKLV